jgi:dienelactone hydrolase
MSKHRLAISVPEQSCWSPRRLTTVQWIVNFAVSRPCFVLLFLLHATVVAAQPPLPARSMTELLGDPATRMVDGIDRFMVGQNLKVAQRRSNFWLSEQDLQANRLWLSERLGIEKTRFSRQPGFLFERAAVATLNGREVNRVRWPVLPHPAEQLADSVGLWAEGLLIEHSPAAPWMVLIPDADESAESLLLQDDPDRRSEFLLRCASRMNVLVMSTVSRAMHRHGHAEMSRREYLHRAAFVLGRTLTGYEIQMIQAAIDRFPDPGDVIVCGFGEGGRTALMTAAVDTRVDLTMVGSYFTSRREIWREPISRQVFGLSNRFGDAELALLVAPRGFVAFGGKTYDVKLAGRGGAPAEWRSPQNTEWLDEVARFEALSKRLFPELPPHWAFAGGVWKTGNVILSLTGIDVDENVEPAKVTVVADPKTLRHAAQSRRDRLFAGIDAYNQALLAESEYERGTFLNLGHSRSIADNKHNRLDTSSVAAYKKSIERFRSHFRERVIGWFDDPRSEPNARKLQLRNGRNWTGYAVTLDVFPHVIAYGELLMPDDIAAGEQRPVVVCQHGLEGRPGDTVVGDHRAYHDFAARLAEQGFIVFCPQNPYIGQDAFRSLQRKAYPIGKTLFSVIGAQHQQILDWLKTIPSVDPNRIAFYGLSYGGKSAMRLPALLPDYCLSICSADFNDWVWKNASSRSRYSYVGTGEYEIFEFGLGKTFNYAEMAALIAPRPFMVERGHFDGVAPDDRVAKEFGKVRFLYRARLGLPDACQIEWFNGPHTINAEGTFAFLQRHLDWPASMIGESEAGESKDVLTRRESLR